MPNLQPLTQSATISLSIASCSSVMLSARSMWSTSSSTCSTRIFLFQDNNKKHQESV